MEAILDTSFILSALRSKIDFISSLSEKGFSIKVPREVIQELKDLRLKTKREERLNIDLALEILGKKGIKKIKLGKSRVDEGLIAAGKRGAYIATLDSAIKRAVQSRIFISSATKGIVIEQA